MLSDETQIFQFGYSEDSNFYTYTQEKPNASAWNEFPTKEKPYTLYKFTSMEVNFSPDQQYVSRSTYSMLDWLGDMGGLLDALYMIGELVIHPFATHALQVSLLSSLFRYRESDKSLQK